MKRLSDLVDSANRDTARAARALRAYGALSLPLASQQRVREALFSPASFIPAHVMRRAALGLAVGLATIVGVQAGEYGVRALTRRAAPSRRSVPRTADAPTWHEGDDAAAAIAAAGAGADPSVTPRAKATTSQAEGGGAGSATAATVPSPNGPEAANAAAGAAVAGALSPSTATVGRGPAESGAADESAAHAMTSSAPVRELATTLPGGGAGLDRVRGGERGGGSGGLVESVETSPRALSPIDDEARPAAPPPSAQAGRSVLAQPATSVEQGLDLPAWPTPSSPPAPRALPPPPGGPLPRSPVDSGLARGGDAAPERRQRFTPARLTPPTPDEGGGDALVAVASFTGVVGGGAIRATVALGEGAGGTTVWWHDPRGEPVLAGAAADADPHEATVDLDGDGEPDVVVRDEECPPDARAGEPASAMAAVPVCVYLREDNDR